jgi:hypothetical protein
MRKIFALYGGILALLPARRPSSLVGSQIITRLNGVEFTCATWIYIPESLVKNKQIIFFGSNAMQSTGHFNSSVEKLVENKRRAWGNECP